jgi:hypothetical protein
MADVKANAEALVPKFKLGRVLNQGRASSLFLHAIPVHQVDVGAL